MPIKLILKSIEVSMPPNLPVMIRTLGTGPNDIGTNIARDAVGNYYAMGFTGNGMTVTKYNSSNIVQWSRTVSYPSAGIWRNSGLVLDGSDKPVVAFTGLTSGPPFGEFHLLRFNPADGTTDDVIQIGNFGGDSSYALAKDGSDNFVLFGHQSGMRGIFVKYDATFTLQWQKEIAQSGQSALLSGVIDNSGDIYGIGRYYDPGLLVNIMKVNSAGTILWQRQIGDGVAFRQVERSGTDGTDIYMAILEGGASFTLAKVTSAGALAWQRNISMSPAAAAMTPLGVICKDGYVYVTGYFFPNGTSNYVGFVMKYTDAGVLEWQRFFDGDDPDVERIDYMDFIDNSMLMVGATGTAGTGQNDILIAQFPTDGSDVGTHGDFTWSVGTFIDAVGVEPFGTAAPYTLTNGSFSEVAATSTNNPIALTDIQQVP